MTSEILTEILMHFDALKLFDHERESGMTPMILLDGHDSRFGTDFLRYITNNEHKWCVCNGVPYATSLWQVGDSNEQNGAFKMGLTDAKHKLLSYRLSHMIQYLELQPTDIMILIRQAWEESFKNINGNEKVIHKRGWFPYNRNLLLHKDARGAMIDEEIEKKKEKPYY